MVDSYGMSNSVVLVIAVATVATGTGTQVRVPAPFCMGGSHACAVEPGALTREQCY